VKALGENTRDLRIITRIPQSFITAPAHVKLLITRLGQERKEEQNHSFPSPPFQLGGESHSAQRLVSRGIDISRPTGASRPLRYEPFPTVGAAPPLLSSPLSPPRPAPSCLLTAPAARPHARLYLRLPSPSHSLLVPSTTVPSTSRAAIRRRGKA